MKQISALSIALLLAACSPSTNQQTEIAAEAQPVASTTVTIPSTNSAAAEVEATALLTNNPAEVALTLNGSLVLPPQNNLTLTLPMGGIVTHFKHLPGTFVTKGELIAKIQNLALIELQQTYLAAAAQTEFLELEYQRQEKLSKEEATSQKRVEESRAAYLTSKSQKEAAQAHLRILGIKPESVQNSAIQAELLIHAPQSGYLSAVNVNQGKYVEAGESICQLINKSELYLQLAVSEKELSNLSVGQSLTFNVNGIANSQFQATIATIDQQVDPIGRSVQIYAKIKESDSRFKPGMYITAQFEGKE